MKKAILILIFLLFINFHLALAEPVENEYGIVDAWFDGKEATVEKIKLKINEPVEIKVKVTSKEKCHVAIYLDNPLVTESYKVISGPSQIDKRIDALNVESGWTETYTWIVAPTGEWTMGNAPINVYVQFTKAVDDKKSIEFTIANPYILDEQYSGPIPTQTATNPSSTDQPPGSNDLPGFGVMGALLGISLVLLSRKV
ncbi:MAG: sarcinarray family MAST domain-containing protein [Methanosarcinales archaeon]|nr:sarcinarray family MAST domain-containing protein [Methanosarcinales archaeon]